MTAPDSGAPVTESSRAAALAAAAAYFDESRFQADLARRVAVPSTSQEPDKRPELRRYLAEEIVPQLEGLGFACGLHDNPVVEGVPFLVAERIEDPALPTVLTYGHADVVRGQEGKWREGLDPWRLVAEGDGWGERWYGRGTADNKAQHTINLAALGFVLASRGRLGFNVKVLLETGEEVGSPGLREFCRAEKERLAADLLVASDGPRLKPEAATLYMGSRGVYNFRIRLDTRAGAHHSGNWGGVLSNPGVRLAHALAAIVGPKGEILVPELRPEPLSNKLRADLGKLAFDGGENAPEIDPSWGEPGLTPVEKLYGWNALEILAFGTGDPAAPVNAIPGQATATCQLRFVVGTDWRDIVPAVERHLKAHGFEDCIVEAGDVSPMPATRLDSDHPSVAFAAASVEATLGHPPLLLPNLGGTIPNDAFSEILGMPTVWVPHSYAGCQQHAPDEHVLARVCREGLQIMTGLWWDIGEAPAAAVGRA